MENKRVEQILLEGNVWHPLIIGYIEQLEKENAELKAHEDRNDTVDAMVYESMAKHQQEIEKLKQQLEAKDKALDKACGKIEYETQDNFDCPNVTYGFTPKCCCEDFCEGSNKECWKEWAENGID